MGKITGGEVTYGRTVKTGDFENKRVDVKLSFGVDDGEDFATILDLVGAAAVAKAHGMLGLTDVTGTTLVKPVVRRTASTPAGAKAVKPSDPLEGLPEGADAKGQASSPPPSAASDPLGDVLSYLPEQSKKEPPTPQQVIERIQFVNKAGAPHVTPKIRELVTKYLDGKPGSAMTIPEEKREAFLLELEKLVEKK